jgi:hypothetical protein
LRYLVQQDLDNIAWWYWLDHGDYDDDIPLLPVQNPHICIWAANVGAMGRIPKRASTICSAECHVRHEFDLWTHKFCPAVEYAVSRMNIGM